MQYTQEIKSLRLNNITDKVVRRVIVEVTLTDGGNSVSSTHDVPLFLPDSENFTPYNELTEEKVLSWIPIDEDMKTMLKNELEIKMSVPVSLDFPWD